MLGLPNHQGAIALLWVAIPGHQVPSGSHAQYFSRVAAAFSSYDGDLSLPFVLALGSPIFPSGCEGKLGVALESLQGLGQEDPLEDEMATHSSVLAWGVPWTEEPGRLQSTGLQRVGQDLATR